MKNFLVFLVLAFGLLKSSAMSLTLSWTANTDPLVAGYKLYYGTTSRAYTNTINVGNTNAATISDLLPGVTYYLAVTVYDTAGVESGFSEELTYGVPRLDAVVQLSGLAQDYDGTAKTVSVATVPEGLPTAVTYNGSSAPPVNAGTYVVVASIVSQTYVGSITNTLRISPATATVILGGLTQAYTGDSRAVAVTTVPAGLAVRTSYNGLSAAPTDAGTYDIVSSIADPNWTGSTSGTLVVTPASVSFSFSGLTRTYDGYGKAVTATTQPAGLGAKITYNGSSVVPTNAGSYAVVATVLSPNYSGSATTCLAIVKAPAKLQLSNLTQSYSGKPCVVTVVTTPAGLKTVVTYNSSTECPIAAGTYNVVATIDDSNYTGTATGTLTIKTLSPPTGLVILSWSAPSSGTTTTALAAIPREIAVYHSDDLTDWQPVTNVSGATTVALPRTGKSSFYRAFAGETPIPVAISFGK